MNPTFSLSLSPGEDGNGFRRHQASATLYLLGGHDERVTTVAAFYTGRIIFCEDGTLLELELVRGGSDRGFSESRGTRKVADLVEQLLDLVLKQRDLEGYEVRIEDGTFWHLRVMERLRISKMGFQMPTCVID